MSKRLISLMLAVMAVLALQAQVTVYEVTKTVNPYEDITGGTAIDLQGMTGTDLSKVLFDNDGNANFNAAEKVNAFPIGFDFTFNGYMMKYFLLTGDAAIMLYTDKVVSTDAHVVGMASPAYAFAGEKCKNSFGVIARGGAFGLPDTEISYKLEGSAGNRVLIIQYKNLGWQSSSSYGVNTEIAKVQMQYRLFEATGNIEIRLNNWKPYDDVDLGNTNWVVAGITGDASNRNWMFLRDWDATDYGPNPDWHYYKVEMINYDRNSYPEDGTTWTFLAPDLCRKPSVAPSALQLTSTTKQLSGTFTKGQGDHHLVLVSNSSSLSAIPVDQTKYNEGDKLGNATVAAIVEDGSFETPDNLSASTNYYVHVFAYNANCSNGPLYNTTPATASILTKPAAPRAVSVTGIDKHSMTVSVTPLGNNPVLLAITDEQGIRNYSSGAVDYLEAGAFGTPSGSYRAGDEINDGGKVIFSGTPGAPLTVDQLSTGKNYYLRAWSSDGNGGYSSEVVDAAVVTASELPWSFAIDEKVGYDASLPGWAKEGDWNSLPEDGYIYCLAENIESEEKGSLTWIETPDVYLDLSTTVLKANVGGTVSSGWTLGAWTLGENEKIVFQLTADGKNYTDVLTIEGGSSLSGTLTPFSAEFSDFAGQKVRLRISIHRFTRGQARFGAISLEAGSEIVTAIAPDAVKKSHPSTFYNMQGQLLTTSSSGNASAAGGLKKGLYIVRSRDGRMPGKKVILK